MLWGTAADVPPFEPEVGGAHGLARCETGQRRDGSTFVLADLPEPVVFGSIAGGVVADPFVWHE